MEFEQGFEMNHDSEDANPYHHELHRPAGRLKVKSDGYAEREPFF